VVSGIVIDRYFTHAGVKDWHGIWLSFAAYSLVVAVAFALLFKHRHVRGVPAAALPPQQVGI
jgi:NHS family xanthosine MFS transporter